MKRRLKEFRTAAAAVLSLAVLCGVFYPLSVWILCQGLFPERANGSLTTRGSEVLGSRLIGRPFEGRGDFHPRPSAAGKGYDALRSGASNLGPTSRELIETVRKRLEAYLKDNGLPPGTPVPADAVTASGSGLDPHISVMNALLQTRRVAAARGLAESEVRHLVESCAEGRTLGILGQPRVNVLVLNSILDGGARGRR